MTEAKRNSKYSSTDEGGQGELYAPEYALKVETRPQKKQNPPGKTKNKVGLIAVRTDEMGQGELYSPAYALKVEPQKKQHPPGKTKNEAEQDDTKKVGNESNERGERRGKNGDEEGHQMEEYHHLEQQQKRDGTKPSSKL